MRPILVLIRKEFRQIFRDRAMLGSLLVMPLIQLFILSYAVTTDVKHLKVAILDEDHSSVSRQITTAIGQSGILDVPLQADSRRQIEDAIFAGKVDLALLIPLHFSRDLTRRDTPRIQLIVDGQNSNTSFIGLGYAANLLQHWAETALAKRPAAFAPPPGFHIIEARTRIFYNPELKSVYYMIPGIITIMLTVSTMMLSAMGLVREKEIGTFEQLMVTPIRPAQLILGKLIPFALLGFVQLTLSLAVGVLWFHIPFLGNPLIIVLAALLFMLATLGMGLFISTLAGTQQQALFIAWFFMIFGMIMSGFFSPIDNMAEWAKIVSLGNPLRYFLSIQRAVLLKGSGIRHLLPDFLRLAALSLTVLTITVARFRARIGT